MFSWSQKQENSSLTHLLKYAKNESSEGGAAPVAAPAMLRSSGLQLSGLSLGDFKENVAPATSASSSGSGASALNMTMLPGQNLAAIAAFRAQTKAELAKPAPAMAGTPTAAAGFSSTGSLPASRS